MAKGKGGFIGYSPLLQNPVVYQGVWSLSTQYTSGAGAVSTAHGGLS